MQLEAPSNIYPHPENLSGTCGQMRGTMWSMYGILARCVGLLQGLNKWNEGVGGFKTKRSHDHVR